MAHTPKQLSLSHKSAATHTHTGKGQPMKQDQLDARIAEIMEGYDAEQDFFKEHRRIFPRRSIVYQLVEEIRALMFPGYFDDESLAGVSSATLVGERLLRIERVLAEQVRRALLYDNYDLDDGEARAHASKIANEFIDQLPRLQRLILKDAEAAYEGDPAAFSKDEIVLCYPGLLASTINRLAHELFLLGVPLIPRMMTEYAHSKTGIDIHPGATIGEYFFMDHGTGIVVGETSIIGKHVKVYQGVTIGALSTRGGQRLKGAKRHPTIEDNVTIYAGASILGGDTTIGEGSVIGSNVFITSSVKPGTRISVKTQELIIRNGDDDSDLGSTPEPADDMEESKPDDTWYYVI